MSPKIVHEIRVSTKNRRSAANWTPFAYCVGSHENHDPHNSEKMKMMKVNPFTSVRLVNVACAALIATALTGCVIVIGDNDWDDEGRSSYSSNRITGSGVRGSVERSIEEIHQVALTGSIDVIIVVGPATRLVIEGDDNLLERVKTSVTDGRLEIGLERGSYRMRKGLLVRVETPHLDAVEISGSGDLSATGVDSGEFTARISGSGDIHVEGRTDYLSTSILGSGDMNLTDLEALRGSVSITGSGDVEVSVQDDLDVHIVGSGDVRYHGDPEVHIDRSGSGDVHRKR